MKTISGIFLTCALLAFGTPTHLLAQAAKPAAADSATGDAAWKELEKALRPPVPPEEWREKRPTQEEIEKFKEKQRDLSGAAADKAKDFYTRFPAHAKASEARAKEHEMLGYAVQLGATNQTTRLAEIEKERLKDPSLSEDDRFELRAQAVQREAVKKRSEGMEAMMAEFEKGVRDLQKEFPKREEVYQMLMMVLQNSSGEKSRALAEELVKGSAPDEVKEGAKAILKKLEMVGKPLNIKFTAVDGREIDTSKMAGKVLLIDFWATWCGPCIAELPNVKAAYDRLHPKGFEIIGISFDKEKDDLVSFVASEKMTWPQYFDGLGWKNKLGTEYGINSIPAMWLVDKKGILRDPNGRDDLEKKVEKLLAE